MSQVPEADSLIIVAGWRLNCGRGMGSSVLSRSLLLGSVFISMVGAVCAHDYWFEAGDGDYALYRGHRFSQHVGELEPYEPAIIQSATCLTDAGLEPVFQAQRQYPLRIQGDCVAVLVSIYSGYWSETPEGLENRPKDELSVVLDSWEALESAKLVDVWNTRLQRPMSTGLELVLTENPFDLEPGDKLRVVATLAGRPVRGVTVAYDGDPRGVTDRNGRINIRIRHGGIQNVSAGLLEELGREKADKRVHSAVLQFELP